jgi:flagellar motor switch protein FliM
MSPEDIVVIIVLNIKLKDLTGDLSICIPAANLEEIFGDFNIKYMRNAKRMRKENQDALRQLILQDLLDTNLEIKAVLDQSQLALQDVLSLQVSDIIPLYKNINSDVCVMVDEIPWYHAKLGEVRTKKAVKLNEEIKDRVGVSEF